MSDYQGRPSIFSHQRDFIYKGLPLNLYLDTDKSGKVSTFRYEYDGRDPFLDSFAQAIVGKVLGDIPPLSEEGKFPSLYFLVRKFIQEIRSTPIPFDQQKGRPYQNLLCRCFGVYVEDIHELVGRGIEVNSLRDLGDHLNAGIGCGTCHRDLERTLEPLLSQPIESTEKVSVALWQKLDAQNLAQEIFQLLEDLNKKEKLTLRIKGTRPGGVLLGCQECEISHVEIENLVQKTIESALGPGLDVTISFSS